MSKRAREEGKVGMSIQDAFICSFCEMVTDHGSVHQCLICGHINRRDRAAPVSDEPKRLQGVKWEPTVKADEGCGCRCTYLHPGGVDHQSCRYPALLRERDRQDEYLLQLNECVSGLEQERDALKAERDRLTRDIEFMQESYLKEHENWGICKWKAQVEALQAAHDEAVRKSYNDGVEAAALLSEAYFRADNRATHAFVPSIRALKRGASEAVKEAGE